MRLSSAARYAVAAIVLGAGASLAILRATPPAEAQSNPIQNGEAGFVVTHIRYALSRDASETGACPNGMSTGYRQVRDLFVTPPDGPEYAQSITLENGIRGAITLDSPNLCRSPEQGRPDPNWRVVTGANVPAEGIDLDGQVSRANGRAAPGTCAHDDFRGMDGGRGVDNQFLRVVGCSTTFQSTGSSNGFETEMLTGSWGILMTLKGVDDIRNDPDVEIGIYANADPIELDASREALPNATYAIDRDPRFQARTRGRIVNGVLTSDPVTVRFHMFINNIRLERPLEDARVQMTFTPDGGLDGYLAGYTPVEAMYNLQFGFRGEVVGGGQPAPARLQTVSSVGYAITQGFSCHGAYYALQQNADGHRDPNTGRCTAISTQYRVRAVPAFVVDAATRGANDDLIH
jgi:hypothetical protein